MLHPTRSQLDEATRINTSQVHGMDLYDAIYALGVSGRLREIIEGDHDDDLSAAICTAILDEIEYECGIESMVDPTDCEICRGACDHVDKHWRSNYRYPER